MRNENGKFGFCLDFSPFCLSPTLFQGSEEEKRFHQPKSEHLWCLQKRHGSQKLLSWLLQDVQGELNRRLWIPYTSALHHVCCEHIVMFCMILNDLWRYTDLSHRKYKGLLLSLGLDTQKFTWIMKNPCVKLMWVCHSNFILVRWFIYLSKMVYRNHNQHGLLQ